MRICRATNLGTIPYTKAFELQKQHVEQLQQGVGEDSLLLLQHPHVLTLGRNADGKSVLRDQSELDACGVELVLTDRGGDVTYHGPGQLVGYPLLRLEHDRRDIRRYVRDLEDVLMRTLADFSIKGRRHPEHRGVWVDECKIASLGIRISRWVTSHGFALNVNTDLSYFALMQPCGIAGCELTSMASLTGSGVDMDAVIECLTVHFGEVFEREMVVDTPDAQAVTPTHG